MKGIKDHKSFSELNVFEFINSFSVFVVIGSVSTSYFFTQFFQADLPIAFYWLLASTVWVIYTLDHIIDGLHSSQIKLSLRHSLHIRYRKLLLVLIGIIVPLNIYIAFKFLPDKLLFGGVMLGCFVLLYILLIPLLKKLVNVPVKEALIALGVTGGMCLLPGLAGKLSLHYSYILLLVVFTLINFLNLLIFSLLDSEEDLESNMPSIVQLYGYEKINRFANQMVIFTFLMIGFWIYSFKGVSKLHGVVVFMLMLNILALILLKREYFKKNDLFRFWGDSIYLVPGLIQALFIEKLI